MAIPTSADPDLWGHLRFGLDTLHDGHLSAIDPYSFTQDRPWLNHEWLSELQMAAAYAMGGTAGLLLLKGVLIGAALWLIWTALEAVDPPLRLMTSAVVILGTGRLLGTLRPQLWSLLCFVILCRVLRSPRLRHHLWLAPLFAFWANVHGGWVVGMGLLGVYVANRSWSHTSEAGHWTRVVLACVIATLLTPYTWQLWIFVWQTVGLGRDITEWQPLWTVPPAAWIPWGAATAAVCWAAWRRELAWGPLVALAGLGYVSLVVERVSPFFVTAAALFLADPFRRHWSQRLTAPVPPWGRHTLIVGACAAFIVFSTRILLNPCIPIGGTWIPDERAARYLDSAGAGRLVTWFDWGQYSIWHWGNRIRVSSDGRRETVYSDRRLAEHDRVTDGTPEGLAVLASWNPEYVWLPATRTSTKDWLRAHGYRVEIETASSFVAVRADRPALVPAASNDRSCFP